MSEHDLPELDAELRALLAIESDPLDPPDGAFERVFERVGQSLLNPPPSDGGNDPTDGSDPSPDPSPSPGPTSAPGAEAALTQAAVTTTATTAATVSLPTAAALAFLLGLGAGIVGTRVATPAPEVRVEERIVERVVEVPVRVVETVYVREDAGVPGGADVEANGQAGTVAVAGSPTQASHLPSPTGHAADAGVTGDEAGSGRDRDLADENALVSRAQAALARGRTSEALAATSEHQRRFPRGEFVEEREALAIQALARSGNLPAAMARAERFRTRYPRSMLLRAVNAAVGSSGGSTPPPSPTPSPSAPEGTP
jgi:hypothetical protein